jgi:membrane protease YdiL (CAAX protease family)
MTAADGGGRRYLVVFAVVAAWIVAGIAFRLSANAYLLLGVPLLVAFQLGIARRPLAELWFKHPGGAPLPWWGWLVAAAFLATPVYFLVHGWAHDDWGLHLWLLCAAAGAFPLALSLARFSRAAVRPLLLCLATAGVLGIGMMLGGTLFRRAVLPGAGLAAAAHSPWLVGLRSFVLYLPICFVIEEVFFRGALDSYLDRPGDRVPWVSATFVSVLWGLWHLPSVVARIPSVHSSAVSDPVVLFVILLGGVTVLPLVHCLTGIPLSLAWRRSGLLFVPAFVHALIDAVRNGLLNWH